MTRQFTDGAGQMNCKVSLRGAIATKQSQSTEVMRLLRLVFGGSQRIDGSFGAKPRRLPRPFRPRNDEQGHSMNRTEKLLLSVLSLVVVSVFPGGCRRTETAAVTPKVITTKSRI